MPWVYVLRSGSGRFYIGSTTDMQRRLEEHWRGHTHTTKRLGGEWSRGWPDHLRHPRSK